VLCLKSALRLERRGEQGEEEAEQRDYRVRRFGPVINQDEVFGTHSGHSNHRMAYKAPLVSGTGKSCPNVQHGVHEQRKLHLPGMIGQMQLLWTARTQVIFADLRPSRGLLTMLVWHRPLLPEPTTSDRQQPHRLQCFAAFDKRVRLNQSSDQTAHQLDQGPLGCSVQRRSLALFAMRTRQNRLTRALTSACSGPLEGPAMSFVRRPHPP